MAVPKDWPASRWVRYQTARKEPPPMPPLEGGQHLIEAFHALGRYQKLGMGRAPLPLTEIEAFARIRGGYDSTDMLLLRAMSAAFLQGLEEGTDEFHPGAWPPREDT